MRIERSCQKRCLQRSAVMGGSPVGGKPFGFDGERHIGRTGHNERLSAWRRISKGQGRKTTTTSKRMPRRTVPLRRTNPELCKLVTRIPAGDNWAHEIKFDGFRAAAAASNPRRRDAAAR